MPDSATVTQSPIVTSASIHSLTAWTNKNGLVSEKNWFIFSRFIKMWFKGIGASYVTDTSVKTVPASKMDLDNSMQIHLLGMIEGDSQQPVLEADTTLDAWKGLVTFFETSTMARYIEAHRHFFNIEHDASQPITVYIQAVKDARAVLKALGCEPDDTLTADVLLMNLHSSFESALLHQSSKSPLQWSWWHVLDWVGDILEGLVVMVPIQIIGERRRSLIIAITWTHPHNHIAAYCVYDMPQQVKDWVLGGPWHSETTSANMVFTASSVIGPFPDVPSDSDSESYEYEAGEFESMTGRLVI
ncbi:uncharacterized protein ARMOST_00580 [Armillaria ostoyae]|uniref:Uncharacterized protein n=1 Tax=Armillaria ostoyae TaxID=47428 RepID=A0A284QLK2_ARMOS|nr:uncharacterized protein ARMOST_00580 [Armillaria ostoyae]